MDPKKAVYRVLGLIYVPMHLEVFKTLKNDVTLWETLNQLNIQKKKKDI